MKMYDSSKPDEGSKYVLHGRKVLINNMRQGCPHASFFRPHAASTGSPRESIEVRMLVFSS